MLVEKQELRKIIIEETIIALVENGRLKEARTYLLENKEHLDEGPLRDLLKRVLPRSTELGGEGYVDRLLKKIDQEDQKEVDELDKLVASKLDKVITKDYTKDGRFEPEKIKAAVEAWFKQRRQDAPGERLEVEEDIERAVMAVIDNLKNAEVEQIANTGGEDDAQDAGGEELEAETPAKTALDLKDIFTDPTQREYLLKGLVNFLKRDQVMRTLDAHKPEQERDAIKNLIKQVLEMDPETHWLASELIDEKKDNLSERLEKMFLLSLIKECINKKNKNIL